jgi:hypothetical protein
LTQKPGVRNNDSDTLHFVGAFASLW